MKQKTYNIYIYVYIHIYIDILYIHCVCGCVCGCVWVWVGGWVCIVVKWEGGFGLYICIYSIYICIYICRCIYHPRTPKTKR
jgi:hypothetical protein